MIVFLLNIAVGLALGAFAPTLLASFVEPARLESVGPLSRFVVGFALGYASLWAVFAAIGAPTVYFRRAPLVLRLAVYFVYELVVSSLQVAWDVITPQDLSSPAIVEMPLDVRSEVEILLVANLISLTPGTLSLDVSADRSSLFVHAMFAEDPEAIVAQLKGGMERMVREIFEEV